MHTELPHGIELPTAYGHITIDPIENGDDRCLLIYKKDWEKTPLLRLHSACLFSESLGSTNCDCSLQLTAAIHYIAQHGGAIVYLFQEGRGVGLFEKIRAIGLQKTAQIDTAEAYRRLGHPVDGRDYTIAQTALASIGFPSRVRLATNNPRKVSALSALGYEIAERVTLPIEITEEIQKYLSEKVHALGHHGNAN